MGIKNFIISGNIFPCSLVHLYLFEYRHSHLLCVKESPSSYRRLEGVWYKVDIFNLLESEEKPPLSLFVVVVNSRNIIRMKDALFVEELRSNFFFLLLVYND